jgi:hypothetical protein
MATTRTIAFSFLLLLCGCESEEEERVRVAQAYLQSRGDVPDDIRLAILEGKVIPGMFPDEAHHAAGAFTYELLGAPKGVFPPDFIFAQRQRPDPDVTIRMFFKNRTQYGGDEAVPFTVTFRNGKAIAIRTREDEGDDEAAEEQFEANYRRSALEALAESGRAPPEGATSDVNHRIEALLAILRGDGRGGPPRPGLVLEGAAVALGQIGRPAVPALITLLGEEHYWTRAGACIALRVVGPEAEIAVPDLRRLLGSKGPSDVDNACDALGAIGGAARAAVPDLIPLLRRQEVFVRNAAARALGRIGPDARSAIPALTEALRDEEEYVRRYSRVALKRIREPGTPSPDG